MNALAITPDKRFIAAAGVFVGVLLAGAMCDAVCVCVMGLDVGACRCDDGLVCLISSCLQATSTYACTKLILLTIQL